MTERSDERYYVVKSRYSSLLLVMLTPLGDMYPPIAGPMTLAEAQTLIRLLDGES